MCVGDQVFGFDQTNGCIAVCKVVATNIFEVDELYEVVTDNMSVFTTAYPLQLSLYFPYSLIFLPSLTLFIFLTFCKYHPFLLKSKGWSAVNPHPYSDHQKLLVGDEIYSVEGHRMVQDIKHQTLESPLQVFTFSVDFTESFYANGLLVHNNSLSIQN